MKILVAVKQVAALDEDFEIRADGCDVEPDFLIRDLNEWDEFSLEEAVRIKEGGTAGTVEVVAVCVGPEEADEALRKALAKGADRAIRVWDAGCEGGDSISVARLLAAVARRENPDLLFAGAQSSDQGHAATGVAAAALLGWPHAAVVTWLELAGGNTASFRRELEGGLLHEMQVSLPAVLTIQLGINTPRYASLRAIKQAAAKPIELLTPAQLGLGADEVGPAGSLSRVRRMFVPEKGRAQMLEGGVESQAARVAALIREFAGGAA